MKIEDTVAIVTGSGSKMGIGRSTAVALAQNGARGVVINYSRSREAALDTAKEVESYGAKALIIQADVSDDTQVRQMVQETADTFGKLDILVNNAGWTTRVRFDDLDGLTEEIWDRTLAVNLKGPFYCIRAAAQFLAESSGVAINITSIGGLRAVGSSSLAYGAAKAGLDNMTKILARALGPAVRVNAVCPGFVEGQWMKEGEAGLGERYQKTVEKVARRIPLKRVARPSDVAQAILALINADFVTGHTLVVDGGYTIRD